MGDKEKPELRMNLAAVKKVDPYAKDIIDTSSYVAFYTFNSEGNEWEKTNVEGPFFVYSRNAEPYHSIFVNNRLNTNSLVEPITADIDLLPQPPFLLYRNERTRIRGFWFYNLAECERIADLVGKLVEGCKNDKRLESMKGNNAGQLANLAVNNNNIDIFSMLSKAQEDFNNAMTSSNQKPDNTVALSHIPNTNHQHQLQHQQQQQQQPEVTSSVLNFFASAKPNPTDVPIFQRMLSNPVPVEQIEKQQRASPPVGNKKSSPPSLKKQILKSTQQVQQKPLNPPPGLLTGVNNGNIGGLENGLRLMRMQSPSQQGQELGSSPLATFLNTSNLPSSKNKSQSLLNATDVSELESRQNPLNILMRSKPETNSNTTPNKPALLLPSMFTSSSSSTSTQESKSNNIAPFTNKHQSNILHEMSKPEPLTQSQLLQAMSYLIKNDPDFVRKLHEAYLKSFTEMVSL